MKKGEIYWEVDFDDPVLGAYYTVVQNHTLDEETKAIARIKKSFDESELVKNGLKIKESQQLYIYRLYELSCNEQIDVNNISVDDFNKIAKYADWVGKAGSVMEFVEIAGYAKDFALACAAGDEKGMADTAAKWIGGAACGYIAGKIAGAMLTALAVTNPLVAFATFAVFGLIGSAIGDEIAAGWQMIFDEIFGLYDEAGAYTYPVDPLILDLDGDGIETLSVEDGVNFDFDNNGFAEKTGWVGKDDGLLVRDIDGNGQIDNGGELFGDLTVADDFTAKNGFEALKYFDTNGDNIIDKLDEIYSELRVWQDANQNGVVDAGELHSLEELGIAGFDLNYEDINETDASGNSHTQKSTYINEDGSVAILEDVWFGKDASDTVVVDGTQEDLLEETEAIKGLPDIQGYGNQYSLHQAMLRDETGELQSLIEQYVATEDAAIRKSMITNIIYVWTGVEDESSTGRGSNLSDSRKLVQRILIN